MEILNRAEKGGLVHKAFHTNLESERELDGICNCYGSFEIRYGCVAPLMGISCG